MWFGSIASIPDGFALCDGTQGTPDLRDRFTMPAGGVFNPNDVSGDPRHQHSFTAAVHTHDLRIETRILAGTDFSDSPDNETVTGFTALLDPLPPFHALVYIMQLN